MARSALLSVVRTGESCVPACDLSVETIAVETGEASAEKCSHSGAAVQTEWASEQCVLLPAVGKGIGV